MCQSPSKGQTKLVVLHRFAVMRSRSWRWSLFELTYADFTSKMQITRRSLVGRSLGCVFNLLITSNSRRAGSIHTWGPLQVIRLLQDGPDPMEEHGDRRKQRLCGYRLCKHAFSKLLGLGTDRFRRLRRCCDNGESAPVDGRTLPRKNSHNNPSRLANRQVVFEFLAEIYETLSEPMPTPTTGTVAK